MKTLRAGDFRLAAFQATVFTPDEEVSSARMTRDLLPQWSERFDGDPIVIPAVDGLPKEVPRLILQSKTSEWRCEIASARANLFWRAPSFDGNSPLPLEISADLLGLLEQYLKINVPRVGRLAAVLNWYCFHDSPGLFLAHHFCKEQWHAAPLNRPENFELHSHKRYQMTDRLEVNSWVRSKTGTITIENEKRSVVLVVQDINTLAEILETADFNQEQRRDFFETVPEEASQILRLYYPEKTKGDWNGS